jgi:hypothetical protein
MKMDALFGAKITLPKVNNGVRPHIIIPKEDLSVKERDALLSSLPIIQNHLMIADKNLSFLIALITDAQKKIIQNHSNIKYVAQANVDIKTLALLVKDGMHILSNPNLAKDI